MQHEAKVGRLRELHVTFHGLGKPAPHVTEAEKAYWLDPQRFEEIVCMAAAYETERCRIVFSFDDGNKSDGVIALPILAGHNRQAQFFVPTSVIDTQDHLGSDDIARLHGAGMTVGSHGVRHSRWTMLGDRDIEEEVIRSSNTLSNLIGDAVICAAIPFGAYNRRVIDVLANLGLTSIYTSDGGLAYAGDWLKARTTIRATTPMARIRELFSGRDTALQKIRYHVRKRRFSAPRRPRQTVIVGTPETP